MRTSVDESNCGTDPPPPACPTAEGALAARAPGASESPSSTSRTASWSLDDLTTETRSVTRGARRQTRGSTHRHRLHGPNHLQSGPASAMTTQSSTKSAMCASTCVPVRSPTRREPHRSPRRGAEARRDRREDVRGAGRQPDSDLPLAGGGRRLRHTAGQVRRAEVLARVPTPSLKLGQKGKVNVRVESNGKSENPRATAEKSAIELTSKANTTSPRGAERGRWSRSTTRSPGRRGIKVTAGFRATSTAGLAAPATWTQPTKGQEPPVKRITGTFSGSWDYNGAHIGWTGVRHAHQAEFRRSRSAGPLHAERRDGHLHGVRARSHLSGLLRQPNRAVLPAQQPRPGHRDSQRQPPEFGAPYSYTFNVVTSNTDFMRLTLSGCSSGNESLNGTTEDVYFGSPRIRSKQGASWTRPRPTGSSTTAQRPCGTANGAGRCAARRPRWLPCHLAGSKVR